MGKKKIKIDYKKCGPKGKMDPRECRKCLNVCDPAVFLMHPTLEKHPDPYNPEKWVVTPVWPDVCTSCGRCISSCPVEAIKVSPGESLYKMRMHG
jgi:NADH-quinone oxidoreductase subunit I